MLKKIYEKFVGLFSCRDVARLSIVVVGIYSLIFIILGKIAPMPLLGSVVMVGVFAGVNWCLILLSRELKGSMSRLDFLIGLEVVIVGSILATFVWRGLFWLIGVIFPVFTMVFLGALIVGLGVSIVVLSKRS